MPHLYLQGDLKTNNDPTQAMDVCKNSEFPTKLSAILQEVSEHILEISEHILEISEHSLKVSDHD